MVVSDDNSRPLTGADFQSAMTSKLGHAFRFHAVVADGSTSCPGAAAGTEFLSLAAATGGEQTPVCANEWTSLFTGLGASALPVCAP